jgi:hypothetical protein
MVVLRDPGEVYALRHSLGPRPLEDDTTAWVERIDPLTLEPLGRSPELAGGPFWPGGLAAHRNGSLYVVYGRHCHRLSAELELLATHELPQTRPYNSFVVLGDGTLATKDIDRSLEAPARISLLDPETLEARCAEVELPESVVARLSADGNSLYAVGATHLFRYEWYGAALRPEAAVRYRADSDHSYGWDPVIDDGQVWFLDNGRHEYAVTMLGAGVAPGAVNLIRIAVDDRGDRELVEVCGLPRGTVTDPPLYDATRRIAIGYDSGNGVVAAFRFDGALTPLWQRELAHAAHMIVFPDTGELVVHDWHGPRLARTRLGRALGTRGSRLAQSRRVRAAAGRRSRDEVVVLDIETGDERARAPVPSMFQSVLFPAPGWSRDLYWCTFSTLARLEVA